MRKYGLFFLLIFTMALPLSLFGQEEEAETRENPDENLEVNQTETDKAKAEGSIETESTKKLDKEPQVEKNLDWGFNFAYYFDGSSGGSAYAGWESRHYDRESPDGYNDVDGDRGRKIGSVWGGVEPELYARYQVKVPFLYKRGNPLLKGNNLNTIVRLHLTPIDVMGKLILEWTPIAFLKFEAGGQLGTGWNFFGLFNGLGLYPQSQDKPNQSSFPGTVIKTWVGGTFQFDLEALWPGEWHHIVAVANAQFKSQYFTGAGKETPWQYRADDSENINGWRFYGTYLLGYQMPLPLSMIGFLVETEEYIGDVRGRSTVKSGGWGSDFRLIYFGPLAQFKLNDQHSLTALFEFWNGRIFTDDTVYNHHYMDRKCTGDFFVNVYRIAFLYNMKF